MTYLNLTTRFEFGGFHFGVEVTRGEIAVFLASTPVATGFVERSLNGTLMFEWTADTTLDWLARILDATEQAIVLQVATDGDKAARRNAKARQRRAVKDNIMGSLNMTRVRANLGGTYYE